jgi:hypothetical protein
MPKPNLAKSKQQSNSESQNNKYNKPHVIIPQEDMVWAKKQKPSINQFWQDCWLSDPYGSRWMPLTTELTGKTLKQAKATLRKQGLFDFKTEMRILEGKRYYETYVINLHGSRRTKYWSGGVNEDPTSDNVNGMEGVDTDPKKSPHSPDVGESVTPGGVQNYPTNVFVTKAEQEFQKASVSSQELLSNSSKELLSSCNVSPPLASPLQEAGASANGLEQEVVVDERQRWLDAGKKLIEARKQRRSPSLT